ncbi:uncharacterized protein LOC132712970 [Ruditapes philippinarum]|uniref:uncharacterized protein LOC132712970 n=1 Tax=Ruditapes philippinarum TaxID=129788 RepID=UPI00295ABFD6|nr:uncharacterized protein LOC132712970 [Ruditapes philippinarum]
MYKTDASGQALFEESMLAVSILDGLKLDEHHVISTTNEPESLLDVSRRQKAGHVYKSKGKGRKRKTVSVEREGEEEKATRGKRLRRKIVRMDSSSDEELTEIAQTTAAHTKQRKDKDISKSPEAEFINEDIAQPSTSGINVRPAQRSRRNSTDSSTDEDKMKKSEEVTELKVTEETGEVGSENIDESEDIDESEEKCKVCDTVNKEFKGEILWIQCDGCNGWLHRACAGLQHHMKWKKATRKGAKFYCCDCK